MTKAEAAEILAVIYTEQAVEDLLAEAEATGQSTSLASYQVSYNAWYGYSVTKTASEWR